MLSLQRLGTKQTGCTDSATNICTTFIGSSGPVGTFFFIVIQYLNCINEVLLRDCSDSYCSCVSGITAAFLSAGEPHSGVLWVQKLKSPLLQTQSCGSFNPWKRSQHSYARFNRCLEFLSPSGFYLLTCVLTLHRIIANV